MFDETAWLRKWQVMTGVFLKGTVADGNSSQSRQSGGILPVFENEYWQRREETQNEGPGKD